jgi:hypothetical protein
LVVYIVYFLSIEELKHVSLENENLTFFNPDGSLLSEKKNDIVECESSGDSASTTNSVSSQNPRDYKYHQNGTKRVKKEQEFFVRKYYKCLTQGCFATMHERTFKNICKFLFYVVLYAL